MSAHFKSAISRLRPTSERRARTTAVATLAAAQNGTSGVLPIGRHAGRGAAWATPQTGGQGHSGLEPTTPVGLRPEAGSAATKFSVTQPFPDRRHARSDDNGAKHDKNASERDEPHRLHPRNRRRNHDGKDDGANDEAVGIHVPREPSTLHAQQPNARPVC
jgi:hypothetical protein